MNPQLAGFQTLSQAGQEMSSESLWPASLTFAGYPSFPASVHAAPAEADLDVGFEVSAPQTFRFLRSAKPPGLVIKPKTSRFTSAGKEWRVVSIQDDPGQEQIRIVADLPSKK